ncbi:ABC transporter permease subunit [Motiliproteus coralliicola]|uniref:ABC transporter permease subunit n=1 Tax=Motiliproteus coralliicola TaxID=2283196 RepID=A0A369WE51_9GAMM|nr:ABC transporter permease [Motiliproteus coralliicola]RDE19573.1 ABC transporter permease subunit [Motiliproteus coralliicola]
MQSLSATTLEAISLLLSGDAKLWSIIAVSFSTTLKAIVIATPVAFVVGCALTLLQFPGRWALISLFNSLLSVPTVVVGLLLYLLLSRSGPFGDLRLLFTDTAMVLGQIALAFPVLVAMSLACFKGADRSAWETARTLGASPLRAFGTLILELRYGLAAACIAAYGRIISEVGCSMMVGGNILNHTRNIPTAIALETSKGEFAQGIALGLVLLLLALGLNICIAYLHRRVEGRAEC